MRSVSVDDTGSWGLNVASAVKLINLNAHSIEMHELATVRPLT